MEEKKAKIIARHLLYKHKISKITLDNLIYLVEGCGFELIDYSHIENSTGTEHILTMYSLKQLASDNYAFTYVCGDSKYIFLEENLTTSEKLYALAHELGHICLKHFEAGSFLHGTFEQEYEANEFAHYILHPSPGNYIAAWTTGHKIASVIIAIFIMIGITAIPVSSYISSKIYHDYYFVTDSGLHYHMADCFYIQGHDVHRMTEEEFKSGEYTPCKVCIR